MHINVASPRRSVEVRLFLVEDLQTTHDLLEAVFASLGGLRLVGTEGTEAEANLWLLEHPGAWDIALIDLVLAQGSGMSVIRRARELHPPGKVAVFSAYASPAVCTHCLGLGADVVFSKADTGEFVSWLCEQRGPPPAHAGHA
ncbi:MAG TPA: response regulator [Ramlibacter sp.]|uniref:response regulator n=1 Tax=Ramlibacter sp. TaxID=1917967 RepID=UPI002D7F2EE3|nr:response regulator [Ramlibacter sp.]HET8748935.1 response regulator [Ramlibacter sp.]